MKSLTAAFAALALSAASLLPLAGCMPPNFSSSAAKAVAEQHGSDAADWFALHDPDVKTAKKASAYKTGNDLYAAVTGTYKRGKNEYTYIYDYENDKMYLSEGYDVFVTALHEMAAKSVAVDLSQTDFTCFGVTVPLVSANDNPRGNDQTYISPSGTDMNSPYLEYLPAGISPEQFAEEVFTGKQEVKYFLDTYTKDMPPYDEALFKAQPNLTSVYCHVPVTLGSDCIYMARYTAEDAEISHLHTEKITDGFYGGYTYTEADKPTDIVKCAAEDGGFTIQIPESAKVYLFSTEELKLTCHFKSSSGEERTAAPNDLYYRECPGNAAYALLDSHFMLPKESRYGYRRDRISSADGTYYFKYE